MKKGTVTQRESDKSSEKTEKGTEASSPSLQKATDCPGTLVGHLAAEGHAAYNAAAKSCAGPLPLQMSNIASKKHGK